MLLSCPLHRRSCGFGLLALFLDRRIAEAQVSQLACRDQLAACVREAGVDELTALHTWIEEGPSAPYAWWPEAPRTAFELEAFAVFNEFGLTVLGYALELLLLCRAQEHSCGSHAQQRAQQILSLREGVESHMVSSLKGYKPETGSRTAVIRTGRNLRSDLDRFASGLASLPTGLSMLQHLAELAQTVGQRTRMLAHVLGLHFWLRTLVVPGRGAPVFIIHEEYTSWQDMLHRLIDSMTRNGQRQLTLAEVGVPQENHQRQLLANFPGLQYIGVVLDQAEERERRHQEYQSLRGQLQEFGGRAALHYASSSAVASAIPLKALDIVIVDLPSLGDSISQDLEWWEARVKPAGILAGRGFGPNTPEGVRAVCAHRFSNDIHVGSDGIWWYVEPDEE